MILFWFYYHICLSRRSLLVAVPVVEPNFYFSIYVNGSTYPLAYIRLRIPKRTFHVLFGSSIIIGCLLSWKNTSGNIDKEGYRLLIYFLVNQMFRTFSTFQSIVINHASKNVRLRGREVYG